MKIGLRLTPHGHLVCEAGDTPDIGDAVAMRLVAAFAGGSRRSR